MNETYAELTAFLGTEKAGVRKNNVLPQILTVCSFIFHEKLVRMARLLILACSNRKRTDTTALPAIERYDGVNFQVLKKLQREQKFPNDLDVLILSAKHGLIRPNTPIECYDQKMTRARATELATPVSKSLDRLLQRKKYSDIFINLGKIYLAALAQSHELPKHKPLYASGGIGSKMKQMKEWVLKYE